MCGGGKGRKWEGAVEGEGGALRGCGSAGVCGDGVDRTALRGRGQ